MRASTQSSSLTPNRSFAALAACALAVAVSSAYAQTPPPDAGQLLNETQRGIDAQRLPQVVPQAPASPDVQDASGATTVLVKTFKFEGATLIKPEELAQALKNYTGKRLDFKSLRQAADLVAETYRARGFLVRTYLPEQDLTSGTVTIVIVEGRLGALRVERMDGARNIGDEAVKAYMLARQSTGEAVKPDDLQRGISLLNDLPGVSASSLLEPGQKPGESQVVVAVKDTPRYAGNVQLDNTGNKSTGEERLTGALNINSPLGFGDQIQLLANKSQGSAFGRLAYSVPVGADGLRATASVTRLDYDYTSLGTKFTGDATTAGVRLSYPIVRSNEKNLNIALSHDRKDFTNQIAAVEINNKNISVTGLTLSGDNIDGWMGGGITQVSASFSSGELDLSGNADDFAADRTTGANRDGSFTKFNWTLQRLQRMTAADTLSLTLTGQNANRNLDSAEKLIASGPFAVRAYSSAEASADEGVVASLEWQHRFDDRLQGVVFYDQASIRRDHSQFNGSFSPNTFDLAGAGVGLTWNEPGNWSLRSTVAWRLGENPIRNAVTGLDADGTRRDPRVFVTFIKFF